MLMGNSSNIESVLKVKSNMDSGMFYGIQKGAISALNLSNKWFVALNKIYIERRKIAWKIADKLNTTYDKNAVGLFVWAKLPKNINNSDVLVDELLYKKNIFITPGKIFGSQGDRYIRISLCLEKSKLKEALKRL
jgi:aspartate/methionine/tyrosine aminotransferase